MLSEDTIQRIKVTGIFFIELYKITTGTLLSLFVPQKCGEDEICSITDNLNNTEDYHKMVMYANFLSMFIFLSYYLVELYREEWCVKYLDIDNNYSDNHLKNIIDRIPNLNKKMDKLNKIYFNLFNINCFIYLTNLGLSVKLLNDNYHSSATISSFVSFVLLVLMKLYNSYGVTRVSIKDDKMTSAYMTEFVSYNVFDKDYIRKNGLNEDINNTSSSDEEVNPDEATLKEETPEETIKPEDVKIDTETIMP